MLLDLGGTDHVAQARLLPQAIKHVRSNSDEFQQAWHYMGRSGMAKAELLDDLLKIEGAKGKPLLKMMRGISKVAGKPGGIYQREEFIGKFIKYLHMREKGAVPLQAVKEANKWLFDYGDLAAWERTYARRVMPFYTFPRKAIPRVLEAMADNPLGFAKYPLLMESMQKYSMAKLDMSEKDFAQIKEDLPEYMQRGSYMLLPYRDANGEIRFFDWTYVLPWGEIADAHTRGLRVAVSNPFLQLINDIFIYNKNSFTGKEIVLDTDTPAEKTAKRFAHFVKTMVPSLSPGGIYWNKLAEAMKGEKRLYPVGTEKKRLLPETVAHTVFGLRSQPIEPVEQQQWRMRDKRNQMKELRSKVMRLYNQKMQDKISDQEYQKKSLQYQAQMRRLFMPKNPEMELLFKTQR